MTTEGLPTDAYRDAMYKAIREHFAELPGGQALEVSGQKVAIVLRQFSWEFGGRPVFDLCLREESFPAAYPGYDLVTADQVLEHVVDPFLAVRNLAGIVRPGGRVLITSALLFPVHDAPDDYWRFTTYGFKRLLTQAGLRVETVGSWGNPDAVRYTLSWRENNATLETTLGPEAYGKFLETNDPTCPVMVWAVGKKPTDPPRASGPTAG